MMVAFSRYEYIHEPILDALGFEIEKNATLFLKSMPPHNLTLYKGNLASCLSRSIIKFALENETAMDLLNWLNDTNMPDEFFWSTLNHNEFLRIDGGYPGRCLQDQTLTKAWVTRYALWFWDANENMTCRGDWRQSLCLFNHRDLPKLYNKNELFVNKFWMVYDPLPIDCMHEFIYNRTYNVKSSVNYSFHESYYESLPAVRHRNWKHNNPKLKSSLFCA